MLAAALYSKCSDGVDGLLFWLNTFCWIYEPREDRQRKHDSKIPHLPFITYDFQDDYVREVYNAINTGVDMLTEKSRDMGAYQALSLCGCFFQCKRTFLISPALPDRNL